MPRKQQRARRKIEAKWEARVAEELRVYRSQVAEDLSELPDAVLVAEAVELFEPYNLVPLRPWFAVRLHGGADTAEARQAVADSLRHAAKRRSRVPWGFIALDEARQRAATRPRSADS